MLAREFDGLDPLLVRTMAMAARLDEIVEELHVELVVLDDEDCWAWASSSACTITPGTLTKGESVQCGDRQELNYRQGAPLPSSWRSAWRSWPTTSGSAGFCPSRGADPQPERGGGRPLVLRQRPRLSGRRRAASPPFRGRGGSPSGRGRPRAGRSRTAAGRRTMIRTDFDRDIILRSLPLGIEFSPSGATGSCRPAVSSACERNFPLIDPPGCVSQRLHDVLAFEVGIVDKQVVDASPRADLADNHSDRDPHAADAGFAAHHLGVLRNAVSSPTTPSSATPQSLSDERQR